MGWLIRIYFDPPLVVCGAALASPRTIALSLSSMVSSLLKERIFPQRLAKAAGSLLGSKGRTDCERFSVSDSVGDPCGASSYWEISDSDLDSGARKVLLP